MKAADFFSCLRHANEHIGNSCQVYAKVVLPDGKVVDIKDAVVNLTNGDLHIVTVPNKKPAKP